MSSSPFFDFVNATLTFKVPGVVTLDASGNPSSASTELIVKAMLTGDRRQAANFLRMGTGVDLIPVTGRCIEPLSLPSGLVADSVAIALIGNQVGEFILSGAIQSPYYPVTILGQRIVGNFRLKKIWGDFT